MKSLIILLSIIFGRTAHAYDIFGYEGSVLSPMSQTQRDALPTSNLFMGVLVLNTTTGTYQKWDGTKWIEWIPLRKTEEFKADKPAMSNLVGLPYFQNIQTNFATDKCGKVITSIASGTYLDVTANCQVTASVSLTGSTQGFFGFSLNPTSIELAGAFSALPVGKKLCITSWEGIADYNAGCSAVREVLPGDKIYLHTFDGATVSTATTSNSMIQFVAVLNETPATGASPATGTGNVTQVIPSIASNYVKLSAGADTSLKDAPYTLPATQPALGQVLMATGVGSTDWATIVTGGGTGDVTQAAASTAANFVKLSNGADKAIKDTGYKIPIAIGTTGQVLTASGADAIWSTLAAGGGSGDVVGPASSVTGGVAIFSGTTGKIIKDDQIIEVMKNVGMDVVKFKPDEDTNGIQIAILNKKNSPDSQIYLNATPAYNDITVYGASSNGKNRMVVNSSGMAFSTIESFNNRSFLTLSSTDAFSRSKKINLFSPLTDGTAAYSYDLTFPNNGPADNQILQSNASGALSWINTPSGGGSGDVVGPASSADDMVAAYSGTTGKILKESSASFEGVGSLVIQKAGQYPRFKTIGDNGSKAEYGVNDILWSASNGNYLQILAPFAPSSKYSIRFPTDAPTANQLMQSDAAGNLSWINTPASDRKLKENIVDLDELTAVELLDKIHTVTFNWKDKKVRDGKLHYGVIAQEIEGILPGAVETRNGIKSVDYNEIVALLVRVVKKQQKEIDTLKELIK